MKQVTVQRHTGSNDFSYVLVTAVHNEEESIGSTIDSILRQTVPPDTWVIISDSSTDGTDSVIRDRESTCRFIRYIRLERSDSGRNFAHKVNALRVGRDFLKDREYKFIGILDGDISLESDYYEELFKKFVENERLGIAGGYVYEKQGTQWIPRPFNRVISVPGGIQVFRRECYEDVGGLVPLETGGEDWCAEIMARMKGWQVRSFPELKVLHLKRTATADGILRGRYRLGLMDQALGSHPLFEFVKCSLRIREKPFVIGSLVRFAGFLSGYFRRRKTRMPDDFVRYLRHEQTERLHRAMKGFFLKSSDHY
jgi:glycosyltransferase involved in cell wall biosynthesis